MTVRSRSRSESHHGVRRERVDGDVGAPLAKFERARGGVGDHLELHALELGRRRPIAGIAFDHDFLVQLRADKAKRPRANRLAIEVLAAAIRHDADGAVGQVPQQRRKRLFQVEDDGVVVGGVDVVDRSVGACLGAAEFAAEQRIEGPLHIARGQRLAIVEANTVMQMKNVGLRIGDLPTLGQPWLQLEVIVAADQRVEEKLVDSLRLRIDADTGVEVGWAALDDHHQRVGIGFARAAEQGAEGVTETQRHREDRI